MRTPSANDSASASLTAPSPALRGPAAAAFRLGLRIGPRGPLDFPERGALLRRFARMDYCFWGFLPGYSTRPCDELESKQLAIDFDPARLTQFLNREAEPRRESTGLFPVRDIGGRDAKQPGGGLCAAKGPNEVGDGVDHDRHDFMRLEPCQAP
jgi:hypothetical protein